MYMYMHIYIDIYMKKNIYIYIYRYTYLYIYINISYIYKLCTCSIYMFIFLIYIFGYIVYVYFRCSGCDGRGFRGIGILSSAFSLACWAKSEHESSTATKHHRTRNRSMLLMCAPTSSPHIERERGGGRDEYRKERAIPIMLPICRYAGTRVHQHINAICLSRQMSRGKRERD